MTKNNYTPERIRPLMPSLKERKRYVAFEVVSDSPINDLNSISKAVWDSCLDLIGTDGCSKAGIWVLEERWDPKKQTGLARVGTKYVNHLKTALAMVEKIENKEVMIRSLRTSGMINKAKEEG